MAEPTYPSEAPLLVTQSMFESSATPKAAVGQKGYSKDGRGFRYVLAGAVDLVAGKVQQGPAIITTHLANTPPIVAAGATSFVYTPGATGAAANFYAGGYLQVDTTPGQGYSYRIADHLAITASTAFTLNLDDPIQVALTASSSVGLIANKYRGVIVGPVTTATGSLVGVATYVITAAQYGWIQTKGLCSVLITGTPALGAAVLWPGTVAGAAQVIVAAGNLIVGQTIGNMAQIGVDGKYNFCDLHID